jgi:hypothetical protein
VDGRLQCRARGGFEETLFEQRGRLVGGPELGEKYQHVRAGRARLRLGKQVGRNRPRSRPLPSSLVRPGRGQCPTMAVVAGGLRRQPQRLLRELSRDGRRAAPRCEPRGTIEDTGDVGVRRVSRQGEVTGSKERVFDDFRNQRVNASPLLAQVLVEGR